MGLLSQPVDCLDDTAIQELQKGMAEAGIGRAFLDGLNRLPFSDPTRLSVLLERISEALDQPPASEHEWHILRDVLGLDLLARLLDISQSSARRYLSGRRSTPDMVARRLHFLALVVGDLSGAYNDVGVRRWFERHQRQLDGNTPAQVPGKNWSPDDDGPIRMQDLAGARGTSPAT